MFLSQQVKQTVIISNKNGKYEFTDELPNDVRLKKISKLHAIGVYEITKCLLFVIIQIFSTYFAVNLFYLHNLKT